MELSTLLTSLTSSMLAVLSWVFGYQALAPIFSALTGVFLAFYFNSVMQKRSWQREVAVKMVAELYGPLYVDVGKALKELSSSSATGYYRSDQWSKVVENYHYRVIKVDMRGRLDAFYMLLDKVTSQLSELNRIADSSILKSVREEFGSDIERADWSIYGFREAVSQGNLNITILHVGLEGVDLTAYLKRLYPFMDSYRVTISLQRRGSNQMSPQDVELESAQRIMAKATTEISEHPKVEAQKKAVQELAGLGKDLRERLGKIVEAPWKI